MIHANYLPLANYICTETFSLHLDEILSLWKRTQTPPPRPDVQSLIRYMGQQLQVFYSGLGEQVWKPLNLSMASYAWLVIVQIESRLSAKNGAGGEEGYTSCRAKCLSSLNSEMAR